MLSTWWHLVLRRLCAGALAMAVALPGLAVVLAAAPAPAAAAGSDANVDVWLEKYIRLRHNVGKGSDYQVQTLKEINGREATDLKKNFSVYPPDTDPGDGRAFIPDAVRRWLPPTPDDPPRFIEMKNYETTPLQPSSNAGRQLDYLIEWRKDYPRRPPAVVRAAHHEQGDVEPDVQGPSHEG